MKKYSFPTRKLTTLGLLVAVALILSFIESRLPAFVAVPGVKIGLANIATVFALYLLGIKEAATVSLLRVFLSALLFGNAASLIYSLAGALLALAVMILFRKLDFFSPVGVSIGGGVAHNIGQILAAVAVMRSPGLFSYLPVLLLSGTLAGIVIGVAAGTLYQKIGKYLRQP